jgi:hypothetical protein
MVKERKAAVLVSGALRNVDITFPFHVGPLINKTKAFQDCNTTGDRADLILKVGIGGVNSSVALGCSVGR